MSQEKDLETPGTDAEEVTKAGAVSPQEFIDEIVAKGEAIVQEWHDQILKYPPKIDAFLEGINMPKNRFPNILLYDKSRVKIKDKYGNDYYHASYVDSYDRPDGYILAQSPFDRQTETDFWRMIYQEAPSLIVVLTALVSSDGKRLVPQFWPRASEEHEYANEVLKVRCSRVDQERDFDNYDISVVNKARAKTNIKTTLLHVKKWVDDKHLPDNMLELRATLKIHRVRAEKEGRGDGLMMFVCPSGVHRAGTLATLDIVLDRMTAEQKVGLPGTVEVVRRQRYGCLAHFDHYAHVADLVVRQAVSSGIADLQCVGVRKNKGKKE